VKVLVTGATGYIGSHTVAELRRRGHDVRVLARNPARLEPVLAPLGCATPEAVAGDMTDPVAVAEALRGCQAVIHAAGEVGVSGGTGPKSSANVEGVRTVVGSAADAGIPVVYTSTITGYVPTTDPVITLDTPPAEPMSAYGASKRAAEDLVRAWQADGAPVLDFTIGGVYGPHSPHLDGSFSAILGALGTFMLVPDGGLGVIDVRDLAGMLSTAVEKASGPQRFLAGGRYLDWTQWTEVLGEAAGTEVPSQRVSAEEMIELGRKCDEMRAAGKPTPPLSEEAAIIMTGGVPTDDAATLAALGCEYRPTVETFRDTLDWLRATGALAEHGIS
jgi:dihydroflavonol-4-reductase